MCKVFVSVILGILLMLPLHSSSMTRNEAAAYIQKSLKNLNTVALQFSQIEGEKSNGYLKAKKGNKYMLSSGGRKIYCNAKKVWNYSVKENKVLISDYSESETSFSLDNIFFGIANNYTVKGFEKENKTGLFILTLKIDDKVAKEIKTEYVKIWLTGTYKIKYIATIYEDTKLKFVISDLAFNPALKESTFKFIAPKGCKIIDL